MSLACSATPRKKIAPAYDNRHLDAESVYIGKFRRDFMDASGVDAEALRGGKSFAGDFQQDALEDRCRHGRSGPSLRTE